MAFAKNAKRVLMVIWERDAQIAAEFDVLFNTSNLVDTTKLIPQWPFIDIHNYDSAWNQLYMEMEEGAFNDELIVNEKENLLVF